ncbi:MAG TPA: TlpA family protein disulfide reductase [Thermodesulfobacteriaceae bacterium]|nr:TlpA family protein disulfide reductase [Thermodesulfobacteriaceae bacterium]
MIVVLLALLAAILFSACSSSADAPRASDFTLMTLEGDSVSLSDFSGKVVLVNFFATYCPPCRAEIPDFIKLQEHFGSEDYVTIGISVDQRPEKILPGFIKVLKISYPVLLANRKVLTDYGNVYALPTTFLLDREHRIVKKYTGMVTEDQLRPLIAKALNRKD